MKLAVISDIHSNLEALRVALATIDARGVDAIYCCGDVVGYGAQAAACVDLVRERCAGTVRGNHDAAVAMNEGVDMLPRDARPAVVQNREQLDDDQMRWLASRPLTLTVPEADATFAHASPEAPERWMRIESYGMARNQFSFFETSVCFIGHTHIPAVMADKLGVLRVRPGHRYLINVGSVGQPRDNNPRLAVAFFDTDAFALDLVREPYDVEKPAAAILDAGLPKSLARRLSRGQ